MFNRRIQHTKPYIPYRFGKPRRKRRRLDFGAIFEAAFIVLLLAFFLWCVFCTPVNAAAAVRDDLPGGRIAPEQSETRVYYESEFNDDSRAAEIYFYLNVEREKCGLRPLSFDYRLSDLAIQRTREIAANFTHTRPDGSRLHGENLAAYVEYWHMDPAATVVSLWVNHTGHRETMLNPDYTRVGIASYRVRYGYDYYVAIFE